MMTMMACLRWMMGDTASATRDGAQFELSSRARRLMLSRWDLGSGDIISQFRARRYHIY